MKTPVFFVATRKFFPDLHDFLKEYNVKAEIIKLTVAMKTSEAAAKELNTGVENIFKSVFLSHKKNKKDRDYALVVLPGNAKIDLTKVAAQLSWNSKNISFASAETTFEKTGFIAGGTPPIGHKESFPIIVDKSIENFTIGYAGGGKPEWLLKIEPKELIRFATGNVADVCSSASAPTIEEKSGPQP